MRTYVKLDSGMILETKNPELWPEATRLTHKAGKEALHAKAISDLREMLKPGDTVYTSVDHVSTSGMTRHISLRIIRDNEPRNITYLVARALDWRQSEKTNGVVVEGCGMDMCFHTVYCLSRVLFPPGSYICPGKDCRSNDHSNGDRNYEPHAHSDGGYALRARDL